MKETVRFLLAVELKEQDGQKAAGAEMIPSGSPDTGHAVPGFFFLGWLANWFCLFISPAGVRLNLCSLLFHIIPL